MIDVEQPWVGAPDLPADSGPLSDPDADAADIAAIDPAETFFARADEIHALAESVYGDARALGADDLGLKAAVVYALLALAEAVVRRDNAMASGTLAMIAAKHYTASTIAADSGRLAGRMLNGDRDAIMGAMRAAVVRYFVSPRKRVEGNDPCVCGSGRKFKRCCGFAGRGGNGS